MKGQILAVVIAQAFFSPALILSDGQKVFFYQA